MAKAKLVTRSATTSTVTDDNLNKASALTHAEMDSNLINLRDSSFGIADDSSTVLQVTHDKTITVAGAGTVGTALSGDTLTITGSGITATSTDTLTNKTFDANGTGNSISNIETADIAAGTLVTASEGIGSNNNDTTIPTSAAVKAYADSVGGGGSATGLTFVGDDSTGTLISDGETVKIAGGTGITTAMSGDTMTITASSGANTGDITFTGSTIQSPSNADLTFETSGTGSYVFEALPSTISGNVRNDHGVVSAFTESIDASTQTASTDRRYYNTDAVKITLTGSGTDADARYRSKVARMHFDPAGFSITGTSQFGSGPMGQSAFLNLNNSTGTSTVGDATAIQAGITIDGSGTTTVTNAYGNNAWLENYKTVTNNYLYQSWIDGSGSITNSYGFYYKGNIASQTITNEYAFYDATNSLSVFGDIQTQAVSITDNLISTNRSNDSLFIGSNGTGRIELSTDGGQLASSPTYPKYHFAPNRAKGVVLSRETSTDIDALTDREYGHVLHYGTTVTNGSTNNNNWAPRSVIFSSHTDMDGESYTKASGGRGPVGLFTAATANNSSGSSASTLYNLRASVTSAGIADSDAPGQNMTITRCVATQSDVIIETTGTSTNTITDAYNFYSSGYMDSAAGNTNTITNLYGFYHGSSHGTNNYAFYDATNSLSVFGDIQTQAISITDNHISTNRSNDNLYIQANGTGRVNLGDVKLEDAANWSNVFGNASRIKGNALTYEDLAVNPNSLTDREMGHAIYQGTKITASSTNSNFRPRAALIGSMVQLDGFSYTNTSNLRGPLGAMIYGSVSNGTSTDVTINTVRGVESSASVADFSGTSGAITIVDAIGNWNTNYHERNGTGDINITNDYGFKFAPEAYNASGGTGVTTITNSYAFHCQAPGGNATVTNAYAFYSEDATASSRMGAIRLDNQSGDPTHGADFSWIYAKDESSSSEVYVKDEAGNVTKISPHNTAGDWEYYSVNSKTGKTVRVNMERMIRKLEEFTGETFMESE